MSEFGSAAGGGSDGYDPTIGIMHEGSDGSSKFIFDLMEPERPKIDARCLISSTGMFSIQPILSFTPDGVCRLNPEMARTVVARVST